MHSKTLQLHETAVAELEDKLTRLIASKFEDRILQLEQTVNEQIQTIASASAKIELLGDTLTNLTDLLNGSTEESESNKPILQTTAHVSEDTTQNDQLETCQPSRKDGKSYFASTQKLDWFFAVDKCKNLGGKLVEPDSPVDVRFISSLFMKSTYNVWIGATDRFIEGTYVWESSRKPLTYRGGAINQATLATVGTTSVLQHTQTSFLYTNTMTSTSGFVKHENTALCERLLTCIYEG